MSVSGPTPDPTPGWLPATFRALRHRNYRLYFLGQLVSITGTFLQVTALSALAHEMTKTSIWPAMISAVQILPGFFLGPLAGVLADRVPKLKLIFVTQAAFGILALALSALVFSGVAQPWHLLVVAIGNGVVNGLDLPARLAFVMEMVNRDDLANAVALNSLLFNAARALGPAAGGVVLYLFSPGLCFFLNGLSYVAVLYALAAMRLGPPPPQSRERAGPSIWAGFAYLARHPRMGVLIVLAGVMGLCGWPFMSLLPKLTAQQLHAENWVYALLVSATGIGALVAALVVATFGSLPRSRWFIAAGVILTILALLGLARTDEVGGAAFCCALAGFALICFFATSQAVVQLGADDQVRGRVLGIWSMMLSLGLPVGSLIAGWIADWKTEAVSLTGQGLGCGVLALGLCGLWLWLGRPRKTIAASP